MYVQASPAGRQLNASVNTCGARFSFRPLLASGDLRCVIVPGTNTWVFVSLTGFKLRRIQQGLHPDDWRPMKTVGSGVREIRIHVDGAHRVFYVTTRPATWRTVTTSRREMAYRAQLPAQFLWASQQVLEKDLKCILFIRRIPATRVRHDLKPALDLIEADEIGLSLTERSRAFIGRIDEVGRYRCMEASFFVE